MIYYPVVLYNTCDSPRYFKMFNGCIQKGVQEADPVNLGQLYIRPFMMTGDQDQGRQGENKQQGNVSPHRDYFFKALMHEA
jgi:hypothetical protein